MRYSEVWARGQLKSSKHQSYLDIYDEIFSKFKSKTIKILEFGVSTGGSLESYANYFSDKSKIIGVDLDNNCKKINFTSENIEIMIGDMTDPSLYKALENKYGKFDIIIDDGGHTNFQMITAFTYSLDILKDDSYFITEDTHSSYLTKFNNPSYFSFMNFVKSLIDSLSLGYLHIKDKLCLISIKITPGIVVFKFEKLATKGNPQIYNQGKKTVDVMDKRFDSKVSLIQLIFLNLYKRISSGFLFSHIKKHTLVLKPLKIIYVFFLSITSMDTIRVFLIRREWDKIFSRNISSNE